MTATQQQDAQLFAARAKIAATWCVPDFNVQGLANTVWAFATASQSDAQLFAALARMAELRPSSFNVQSLANTAWHSTARLPYRPAAVHHRLGTAGALHDQRYVAFGLHGIVIYFLVVFFRTFFLRCFLL